MESEAVAQEQAPRREDIVRECFADLSRKDEHRPDGTRKAILRNHVPGSSPRKWCERQIRIAASPACGRRFTCRVQLPGVQRHELVRSLLVQGLQAPKAGRPIGRSWPYTPRSGASRWRQHTHWSHGCRHQPGPASRGAETSSAKGHTGWCDRGCREATGRTRTKVPCTPQSSKPQRLYLQRMQRSPLPKLLSWSHDRKLQTLGAVTATK